MNFRNLFAGVYVFTVLYMSSASFAADGLAKAGKVLFEDDFSRSELAPKWRIGKGTFAVKDGVVTTSENPADHHGAYAYVKPPFEFKDIVVEFSAKVEGGKNCNLMVNDSKYKEAHAGHILRATLVAPGKVSVADYKFGAMKNDVFEKMKDPKTTADEKKRLQDSIKDKQATFKSEDYTAWRLVRVEIVGSEMLVTLDGKPTAYIKSEGIDHATKNAIGFEVAGQSWEIKGLKIWEATLASDWAAHREAVVGSLAK